MYTVAQVQSVSVVAFFSQDCSEFIYNLSTQNHIFSRDKIGSPLPQDTEGRPRLNKNCGKRAVSRHDTALCQKEFYN